LQPVSNRVYVVVANRRRVLKSTTEPIEWITFPASRFDWGLTTHWIGQRRLVVSDWERTILDGLHLPRRIGGVTELAGALARYPDRTSPSRLVDYVKRYGLVSVMKRVGWLLERVAPSQAEAATGDLLKAFPASRQRTPTLLDPSLPETGALDEKWKLIVNIANEDLVSSIKS
jgi:predicted transcriptional regulator of viral defense system